MSKKKKKQVHRKPAGLAPGTLVFTGKQYMDMPNVTLTLYNQEEIVEHLGVTKDSKIDRSQFISWYDVRGVHDLGLVESIGKKFNVHTLALEDIVDTHQRPKFEDYGDGIFITLRSLRFDKEELSIHTEQVSIYAGEKFILTFQEDDDDLFIPVRERMQHQTRRIRKGESDYLLYALVDLIVDNYYHVLDAIEEKIEELEEDILMNQDNAVKGRIHQLKVAGLHLKKSISPLREAISQFMKSENALIAAETKIFIRDMYDHVVQIIDSIESYRDLTNGLKDLYLSELSMRMNSVMQVLTIITTIFVPLSFLAGLYGMNFDHMPELHWENGYYFLLGIMFLVGGGLLVLFKIKKWM